MACISSLIFLSAVLLSITANESEAIPTTRPNCSPPREEPPSCGYQACPRVVEGKLNVHLVPHTHDDVGWLKTVDQYYWGSRNSIAKAGVQYIIDSVIQELLEDPSRRFIYVETAYLWKWWLNQNDRVKSDVRKLVDEGRLEIIGGGWSMNDEATTHYQSIIDQFTWGFRRLNDTFGACARPRIGWQIDPFGHSREQASIFAQMGFDGLFFGRLDYQDKARRLTSKTAEMIWKASDSLGEKANLFTGALFNTYSPPPGFCFDVLCDDEPIIDDPKSPDYNVDTRVESLLSYAKGQSGYYRSNDVILTLGGDFTYQDAEMWFKNLDKLISRKKYDENQQVKRFLDYAQVQRNFYKTDNVFITMGDDFNYQSAELWYKNMDKLIRYANERNGSDVNVFYSTPSCYLKALNDLGLTWPTKSDDFFPYASDPHTYWTGYFTSRPAIKFYERTGNNYLQISKQLAVFGGVETAETYLEPFREAMGVLQHHDAVTGTEKQPVADDYARILYKAINGGETIVSLALKEMIAKKNRLAERSEDDIRFYSCHQLNVSACPHTEDTANFVVTLYNPQSRKVTTYVRLPVTGNSYEVKDSTGASLATQIVPIPATVQSIPGRESSAVKELIFRARNLPAFGFQSFYISQSDPAATDDDDDDDAAVADVTSIENALFRVTVNADGTIRAKGKSGSTSAGVDIVQSFHYYEGSQGNNAVFANRSSGAYIFRPRSQDPKNLTTVVHGSMVYDGPLVSEMQVKVNEWISQIVRIYKGEEYVEYDWIVGPIPVEDKIGKEAITRYSSGLNSGDVFYTDSNGREMVKREKNFRPTWPLRLAEPVAGNYYPVTAKISIVDPAAKTRLSVLNDRSQGGTSLSSGQVDLMLHRRLLRDDAFGVGEALNETAYGEGLVIRGRHRLVAGTSSVKSSTILAEKETAWDLLNPPCVLVSPAGQRSFEDWRRDFNMEGFNLAKELPRNVRVLTLEPWKTGTLLLRLEHMFELGEDTRFSHPVEVNVKDLFASFVVTSARETTLGGNVWLNDSERLTWITETNDVVRETRDQNGADEAGSGLSADQSDAINVLLKPMEIRTFVINVAHAA